jgi:hypothetical protein
MLTLGLCVSANAVVVSARPKVQPAVKIVNDVEKKKDKPVQEKVLTAIGVMVAVLLLNIAGSLLALQISNALDKEE